MPSFLFKDLILNFHVCCYFFASIPGNVNNTGEVLPFLLLYMWELMPSTVLRLSCLVFVKIHMSNLSLQWIKQQIPMTKDQILCTSGVLSLRVSRDHLCVTWICSDLLGIFSKFLLSPAAKHWFVFHKLCSCFCCLCEVS